MTGTSARPGAVVIGGGIAGLATAALLARDGYDVDAARAARRAGRARGVVERGRLPVRHRPVLVPHAGGVRPLLPAAGHHRRRAARPRAARPGVPGLLRGARPSPVDIAAPTGPRTSRRSSASSPAPAPSSSATSTRPSAPTTSPCAGSSTRASPRCGRSSPRDVLRQAHRLGPLLLRSLESLVAAHVTDPRLRQILGYPAVFLGSSPDRAPSMYHLMSALDLTGGVLYPQGGFARLIEVVAGLASGPGARLRTGAPSPPSPPARGDGPPPAGRGPSSPACGTPTPPGTSTSWPRTSSSAPPTSTTSRPQLLPPWLRTYPQEWWDRRTRVRARCSSYLGVRGRLPQLAHHSLFFTRDWRANFDAVFGGRVPAPPRCTCASRRPRTPRSRRRGTRTSSSSCRCPPTSASAAAASPAAAARWSRRSPTRPSTRSPRGPASPTCATRIVVRRTVGPADFAAGLNAWRGGMLGPAHTLRQSAFFRAGNASRKVAGLYYAGSSTIPGIGLPMCLISAEIMAERVRDTGRPATDADGGGAAMTGWLYLAALLVALGCLALLDRRWRLVLWADARRGAVVLAVGTGVLPAVGRGGHRGGLLRARRQRGDDRRRARARAAARGALLRRVPLLPHPGAARPGRRRWRERGPRRGWRRPVGSRDPTTAARARREEAR